MASQRERDPSTTAPLHPPGSARPCVCARAALPWLISANGDMYLERAIMREILRMHAEAIRSGAPARCMCTAHVYGLLSASVCAHECVHSFRVNKMISGSERNNCLQGNFFMGLPPLAVLAVLAGEVQLNSLCGALYYLQGF